MSNNELPIIVAPTSESMGIVHGQHQHERTSLRKQGRPAKMFPKSDELPWHFSWITSGLFLNKKTTEDSFMAAESKCLAASSKFEVAAHAKLSSSTRPSNYMIGLGGSSLPCERFNYPAMIKEGVGLIVNLTEAPVTPGPDQIQYCSQCNYDGTQVFCEPDVFDDVFAEHGLEVLHLPIRDGHIPHPTQVEIFIAAARHCINERGRKVTVHCHAGVGRTGTMLALYLMSEYKLTPEQALQSLRHDRPQSLQYNPDDWFEDPFIIRQAGAYERNLLQERFLSYYYQEYLLPEWSLTAATVEGISVESRKPTAAIIETSAKPQHIENCDSSVSPTASTGSSISTLGSGFSHSVHRRSNDTDNTIHETSSADDGSNEENEADASKTFNNSSSTSIFLNTEDLADSLSSHNDSLISDISIHLEEISLATKSEYVFVPKASQEQIDQELAALLEGMTVMHTEFDESKKTNVDLCYNCRGILAVGPSIVRSGSYWPHSEDKVVFINDS